MKKTILAVSLSAIILFLCGCGTDAGSVTETSVPQASPAAVPPASEILPSANAGLVIPLETKVYATEGELDIIKPLFESYLSGKDLLAFAVSAVFKDDVYIMGFVYENNEDTLPFSRVIGLKDNGGTIEEAFISDNYKNPIGRAPENLIPYSEGSYFNAQAFNIDGMLVVKTNESLNPDCGFHNFFLINEEGLLDNHINTNLYEPCELFEYNGKMLLNERYSWYEFTAIDKKIVLNEITDYAPYVPKTDKSDFVITLKGFKPNTYDESIGEYRDDNYINVNIDDIKTLYNENFNKDMDDAGWGPFPVYLSKETFKIGVGMRIILLYPPGMKINFRISGEMDDSGFEHSSLPGAVILRAQEPGVYTVQIENDSVYQIYITAE